MPWEDDAPLLRASRSVDSFDRIPQRFLDEAVRRVGLVALLYGVVYAVAFGSGTLAILAGLVEPGPSEGPVGWVMSAVFILLGFAGFGVARYSRLDARTLLDYALLFEVVGAFGIVVPQVYGLGEVDWDTVQFIGISWVGMWVLMFGAIVPATRGKVALASFAAAMMGPIALLVAVVVEDLEIPGRVWFQAFAGDLICAAVAVWINGLVGVMGRQVGEAVELGSYRLTERIGAGGMGEVWRAEHAFLARPAAIKLIQATHLGSDRGATERMLKRFEREVQATATLSSPHTVEVYDFGLTPDGAFYYVMEFLDGMDLGRLVEQFGPQPAARVAHILLQACDSLGEAHGRGMVHRDVKPANLFVTRMGLHWDFVKVLDFGLVKTAAEAGVDETRLTAEGAAAGSPAFMAPEVATGAGVDARTDLYALGCVAYWLLTGDVVFEGESPMHVILRHVQDDPIPPSMRSELAIPDALESLVMRLLAKKPADRPASCAEVAEVLEGSMLAREWGRAHARHWWDTHAPHSVDEAFGRALPP